MGAKIFEEISYYEATIIIWFQKDQEYACKRTLLIHKTSNVLDQASYKSFEL